MPTLSTSTVTSIHTYRPHIDGLRAIAVISVVLYHAGSWINGGFAGVDVFFVISGFLIIGQIVEAQRHGTFSFQSFWARRALRILPPYFLVIAVSACIAYFVLIGNDEIEEFSRQVKYSGLMAANHLFLRQGGYFDGAAELKPLLHLWSLAVEEQFYLAAPVLIAALAALYRRNVPVLALAAALFIASLTACILLTGSADEKNPAFYLMPLRAWEFMAGGAIGAMTPYLMRLAPQTIDRIGLAALIGLLLSLTLLTSSTPFPSFYALFPVLSTVALIATSECRPKSMAARVLSLPPVVAIGLVSYSWYLWHWPLLAFTRIHNFGELPQSWAIAAALVSLILAALTYLLIERPIKSLRRRKGLDQTWAPVWAGLGICAVIVFAGVFSASRGQKADGVTSWPQGPCSLNSAVSAAPCIKAANGRPAGILIGDSHAKALWPSMEARATASGYQLTTLTGGGCIGLFDVRTFENGRKKGSTCNQDRANGLRLMKTELNQHFATITNRWLNFSRPKPHNSSTYELAKDTDDKPADNQRDFFVSALKHTVSELRAIGVRRILIVGPVPEFHRDPTSCVVRAAHYGMNLAEQCGRPRLDVERETAEATSRLKEAIGNDADVRLVDMLAPICDHSICRPDLPDGTVLYSDTNHLSAQGAAHIEGWLAQDLQWLMSGGGSPTAP
jgi:peptidoglycan/LPS O-acetylase OafA/YrhL